MEDYRIIKEYPNYKVSNLGNIKSRTTGKIMKQTFKENSYNKIGLSKNGIKTTLRIHRLVAETFLDNPNNKHCVDHIDNNKLNNNLINLRWATTSENAMNTGIKSNNTSGVKGVSLKLKTNKWVASIKLDGVSIHIGCFDNLEDAKQARIKKEIELFGEFNVSR